MDLTTENNSYYFNDNNNHESSNTEVNQVIVNTNHSLCNPAELFMGSVDQSLPRNFEQPIKDLIVDTGEMNHEKTSNSDYIHSKQCTLLCCNDMSSSKCFSPSSSTGSDRQHGDAIDCSGDNHNNYKHCDRHNTDDNNNNNRISDMISASYNATMLDADITNVIASIKSQSDQFWWLGKTRLSFSFTPYCRALPDKENGCVFGIHARLGVIPMISSIKRYHDEQQRVQKKTFTNWVNSHLRRLSPPVRINDLFKDIGDGVTLIRLLEVLSSEKLQIETPRVLQRAHKLSNVRNALDYLEKKCKIKLVNINPSDVVDGKPAIVLGLIWSIILFFQIHGQQKVLKQVLKSRRKSLSKSIDAESTNGGGGHSGDTSLSEQTDSVKSETGSKTRQALLSWLEQSFRSHKSTLEIRVTDFASSWRDGKAFCALVHNINPSLIDMEQVNKCRKNRENLEYAFSVAEQRLGIPRLLDAEGKSE
ncbi:unnamed protein product [Trichobilharzia szidati]|nr:unnamed protein product [Trichobilharzia szidati]